MDESLISLYRPGADGSVPLAFINKNNNIGFVTSGNIF